MARIIDYVDAYCNYDSLVTRTGRITALKELVVAEEELLNLAIHMRKLDRELDANLERIGIAPATLEAYESATFKVYKVRRATVEARLKTLVNGIIPNLEAQVAAKQ